MIEKIIITKHIRNDITGAKHVKQLHLSDDSVSDNVGKNVVCPHFSLSDPEFCARHSVREIGIPGKSL
jgi:hypothetical protein